MIKNRKIGVIILAAGSSSRLGHPKQLVKFRRQTLLQHVIDLSESIEFDSRMLVLGANVEKIENKIDKHSFEITINDHWEEGMSTSIKKGLNESLKIDRELEHILILVSDQPFITKENIDELIKIQLAENTQATFSEYKGVAGVPAIFSREIFPKLEKLKGDNGAKKLISEAKLEYKTVKFIKGIFDVDTKEDVEYLKELE